MSNEPITVPSVDLNRYLGTWFEIARKPMRHEDEHSSDVTAHYSLNEDGSVRVLNSCLDDKNEVDYAEGKATAVDDTNAKLEVTFLPAGLRWIPFTKGDYWILRLDADYQTALVGDPDRKYLWLLHRQHAMPEATINEWLQFAAAQGYDISDIIRPRQSGNVHTPPKE